MDQSADTKYMNATKTPKRPSAWLKTVKGASGVRAYWYDGRFKDGTRDRVNVTRLSTGEWMAEGDWTSIAWGPFKSLDAAATKILDELVDDPRRAVAPTITLPRTTTAVTPVVTPWTAGSTARVRDSQRKKVYRSEWAAFGSNERDPMPEGHTVQTYVRMVEQSVVWGELVGENSVRKVRVERKRTEKTSSAWATQWRVAFGIGSYHNSPATVLHEMAHLATHAMYGRGVAGHGPEFCGVYLKLVDAFLGADAAANLRRQYALFGARVRAI